MELTRKKSLIASTYAFSVPFGLLIAGITAFGIWDPWELDVADKARLISRGQSPDIVTSPGRVRAIAQMFKWFGVDELNGRLPLVLYGMAALVAVFFLVKRFRDTRTAAYATLIAGTTPLFLFNSRMMIGHSMGFAAQALLMLTAASAIFFPTSSDDSKRKNVFTGIWLVAMLVCVRLAITSEGALVGAVPPLLAVAFVAVADGTLRFPLRDVRRVVAAAIVWAVLVGLLIWIGIAFVADDEAFSFAVGAAPQAANAPTYDSVFNKIFHSFAPWSALLPLAVGRLFFVRDGDDANGAPAPWSNDRILRTGTMLWIAGGYLAQTLFESRYGITAYLPVAALAVAVATLLSDIEDSKSAWWAVGVIGAIFVGLILRDYDLYPSGPIEGLGLTGVTVPEVFNPKLKWVALLGAFAVLTALATAIDPDPKPFDARAPYRWIKAQWQRTLPFKIWLSVFATILLAALIVGAVFRVMNLNPNLESDVPLIVRKWLARLMFIPMAIPLIVSGTQVLFFLYRKLGEFRLWPLLVAGSLCGWFASTHYLPELSEHFSPREIYDTYNAHARDNEPFAQFGVGGRAASFYARGQVRDIPNQGALVQYLQAPTQQWAAFAADQLPAIDRAYRERTGRHVFVADARSARVLLASSQPVQGIENQNFIARFVLPEVPNVQHRLAINFDNKIELVGYDLDLPHDGYVGGGESFTITWYYRCIRPVPGGYKIFLHIDGAGNRLNGDHEPVDERYPVRLWNAGDVIKDVQRLTVPGNYRPGNYTMFLGFYAGESRLSIVGARNEDDNRANAGVLRVQ